MVDILLASYNGERYLLEQIESIKKQTFLDWRLLIRDDGSSDSTKDLIIEQSLLDSRIVFIEDGKGNLGVVHNFEELLKYSIADYVMFSDQDDVWLPHKIEVTYMEMRRNESLFKGPILVCTDVKVVNEKLGVLSPSYFATKGYNVSSIKSFYKLGVTNCIMGCTMMINSESKKYVLPFSSNAIMHDWWIGLIIVKYGKIFFLNESTSLYRQHANNQIGLDQKSSLYYLKRIRDFKSFFIDNMRYYKMMNDLPFHVNIVALLIHKLLFSLKMFFKTIV